MAWEVWWRSVWERVVWGRLVFFCFAVVTNDSPTTILRLQRPWHSQHEMRLFHRYFFDRTVYRDLPTCKSTRALSWINAM